VEEPILSIPAEVTGVLDISVLTAWRKIGPKVENTRRAVSKFTTKKLHQQLQATRVL